MKRIILSIVSLLAIISSAGAQEAMTKQQFSVWDFTSLSVSHAFDVQLVKGDICSVTLEYPADCAEYISVSQHKSTLFIGLKKKTPRKWLNGRHTYRATIVMPDVYNIYLSGASRLVSDDVFQMNMRPLEIELSGAAHLTALSVEGPSIEIKLSGASKADINVRSSEVEVDLSGASKLSLTGSTISLEIDSSGASSVNARNLNATVVDVDCSGASKSYVFVERELKVELSGASKCEYIAPEGVLLRSIYVSGASSLKKVR